jgi:hypothetical protein
LRCPRLECRVNRGNGPRQINRLRICAAGWISNISRRIAGSCQRFPRLLTCLRRIEGVRNLVLDAPTLPNLASIQE